MRQVVSKNQTSGLCVSDGRITQNTMKKIIIAIITLATLTGCATRHLTPEERARQEAASAAFWSAVLGGMAGQQAQHRQVQRPLTCYNSRLDGRGSEMVCQ